MSWRRYPTWTMATVAFALCAGGGCQSSTEAGASSLDFVGTWTYTAVETAPTPATLTGTLTISSQSGRDFNGTLAVTQTNGQGGSPINLGGIVSGRVIDSTTVDFDAFLTDVGRRHIGTVRGNSVVGEWIEAPGANQRQGTFAGRRATP